MKFIVASVCAFLTFCASLFAAPAPAAPTAPPAPAGNRFLFIVDISSGMRRTDAANRQALFDLVYFGVNQQMRPGDTFGVWTYNLKVYAGEFPMQVWHPETNLTLASWAATFLKGKRYAEKSEVDPLVFSIMTLVRNIKDVNLFILTDGETAMRGTPFDQAINSVYKQRRDERRKAEKPFITALAARGGEIVTASVTLPGEAILLPPPPVAKVAPPKPELAASTNTVAAVVARAPVQSIMMRGSPAPADSAAKVAVPQTPLTSNPVVRPLESAQPAQPEIVSPVVGSTPVKPAPAKLQEPATALAEPASSEVEPAKIVSASLKAVAVLAEKGIEKTSPTASSEPQPSETAVAAHIDKVVAPTPSNQEPGSVENKGIGAPTISTVATEKKTAPAETVPAAIPQPLKVMARESDGSLAKSLGPSSFNANSAVAGVTPKPLFNPQLLILLGCALLACAMALLVMVFRHVRRLPEPSLITRSMERQ